MINDASTKKDIWCLMYRFSVYPYLKFGYNDEGYIDKLMSKQRRCQNVPIKQQSRTFNSTQFNQHKVEIKKLL